jgi:hypothetical protein
MERFTDMSTLATLGVEFSCDFSSQHSPGRSAWPPVPVTVIKETNAMLETPVSCRSISEVFKLGKREFSGRREELILYFTKPDKLAIEEVFETDSFAKIAGRTDLKLQLLPVRCCRLVIYDSISRSIPSGEVYVFPLLHHFVDLEGRRSRDRFRSQVETFLGASVRKVGVVDRSGPSKDGYYMFTSLTQKEHVYAVLGE